MFSPGIAAILTKLIFRENLQEFGWQLGERKCLLLGLGIPFLYALSIYSFVWLTGLGGKTFPSFSHLLIFATLGLLSRIVAALGEEIGWRGLLTPELIKITSFTKTVIITGFIWAIWHYPATIYADYNNPSTPIVFQ